MSIQRFLLACSILSLVHSAIAAKETTVAPTVFQAFAAQPSSIVTASQEIGLVDSSDAKVTITILIVEDTAAPGSQMHGVRFDLENNAGVDTVFLDRDQLASVREDLVDIEENVFRLENERGAPYNVHGTASCWRPEPAIRILCPSYRIGPDWAGFTLSAFGGWTFAFPNVNPFELRIVIDQAMAIFESNESDDGTL